MASSAWAGAANAFGLFACGAVGAHAINAHLPALTLVALLAGTGLTFSATATAGRLRRLPPVYDGTRAERTLRWLGAIVDRAPTPLIGIEGDRLTALNRAARALFETDDLIAPPPSLADALADIDSSATTLALDGSERRFQVAVSEVDGLGRIASLTDITAELRVAQSAATRELMRVLGHEVLNGMTPIASLAATAAELAHAPDGDGSALTAAIDTIARRAAGLVRFTQGFRELARLPPPERTHVLLKLIFDDIARLFAEHWPSSNLMLSIHLAQDNLSVFADADQLSAALWALIDNAAHAIGARNGMIRLVAAPGSSNVTIKVADDGPGVADAHRHAIFAPFFSTRPTGTGVGLSLARDIFRAHAGELDLLPTAVLGWTAPNGIAMCQSEFVERLNQRSRPWSRLPA